MDAPVIRRAADGGRVCKLEDADIEALKADGWTAPEVFVAKGRDGRTDIWGVIHRPKNFDPTQRYPVIDLRTRKVEITSQNHNFAVRFPGGTPVLGQELPVVDTPFGRVQLTHTSLNDGSVEGMRCLDRSVFSVQYHPEASPGPHDSAYLFEQFVALMETHHA